MVNNTHSTHQKTLVTSGVFMGIGLGGFFDGILFHQLLQIHNMLSARVPNTSVANVEINMFWDGLFHTLTYTMTLVGLGLLWKAGKRPDVAWSGRTFLGSLVLGWGLFNGVEGIINHHILHIHHVVESRGLSVFDYVFVASGVVLIFGGSMAIRSARPNVAELRSSSRTR